MRRTVLATAVLGLLLSGCGHVADGPRTDATGSAAPSVSTSSLAPRPTASLPTATLPDLVGKGLQSAQDAAVAAGFEQVHSHDATGRGRAQVVDRDWKVCFSRPGPGKVPVGSVVELAAVKAGESCPARDQGLPVATDAPATMPDLRGRSLRVAHEALGLRTTVNATDAKSGRAIVLAASWQVCTQDPAPGAPFDGSAVTLTVVKFGETC